MIDTYMLTLIEHSWMDARKLVSVTYGGGELGDWVTGVRGSATFVWVSFCNISCIYHMHTLLKTKAVWLRACKSCYTKFLRVQQLFFTPFLAMIYNWKFILCYFVFSRKFYSAYGSGPKAFDLFNPNYKSTCQR